MKKFLDGSFSSIPADMVIKSCLKKIISSWIAKIVYKYTRKLSSATLQCNQLWKPVNGKEVLDAKMFWNQDKYQNLALYI